MPTSFRALGAMALLGVTVLTGCGSTTGQGANATSTNSASTPASDAGKPAFCTLLTAAQLSTAVGSPVTLKVGPFGDCEFSEEDVRGVSGSVGTVDVDTNNGGYAAYKAGAGSAMTGAVVTDLPGVGENAFIATGTTGGGGTSINAAGGAEVGARVITVNLSQARGMTVAQLETIATALLKLAVGAL